MALLGRYRVSLTIVLAAAAAVGAVFAFARPEYRREYESEMFELVDAPHHSLVEVRAAFARHDLPLRYDNGPSEPLWLSSEPGPWNTSTFYVIHVSQRSGTMSWGPTFEDQWEARLGNVLVHYGGDDEALLAQIKAAADELD